MNVAIGPFDLADQYADWPLVGSDTLAPTWTIRSYSSVGSLRARTPVPDVLVRWSPEYVPNHEAFLASAPEAYKVAALGDHHVSIPDLHAYDLIAADWSGVHRLREMGYPAGTLLYWRQFGHDPRLHTRPRRTDKRDIDVAFLGRATGGERDELLQRLVEWAKRSGHSALVRTTPFDRGVEAEGYRHAKIVFNYSQRGEINMRCYESIACGALAVVQHDTAEVYRLGAGIFPTYEPAYLEPFLDAWLRDDAAREAQCATQQRWLQHERPVDHLRFLLEHVQTMMEKKGAQPQGKQAPSKESKPSPKQVSATRSEPCTKNTTAVRSEPLVEQESAHQSAPFSPQESSVQSEPKSKQEPASPSEPYSPQEPSHKREPSASPVPTKERVPPENEQRREIVVLIPPEAKRVLDFGCGNGGVGWRLRQDRLGISYLGLDANPKAVERCNDLDVLAGLFDLNQTMPAIWKAQGWYLLQHYDVLLFCDVLEHLVDPWRVLELARPLLAPGGIVIASVPQIRQVATLYDLLVNGDWHYHRHGQEPWRGPHDNVLSWAHIRAFTQKTIQELFANAGYGIQEWHESRLSAPKLNGFAYELAALIEKYDGDGHQWLTVSHTIQHIVVARVQEPTNGKDA